MAKFSTLQALSRASREFKLQPPHIESNMLVLQKDKFSKTLDLLGLSVPKGLCKKVKERYSSCFLSLPRVKSVVRDPHDASRRILLFTPLLKEKSLNQLPEEVVSALLQFGDVVEHSVCLTFDYWQLDQIFKAILPFNPELVTRSFETVGHIAHLNLRPSQEKYKFVIAQVFLEKNSIIKTVVNKLKAINHTFRHFQMELLAGENNYITEVRENGSRFRFDYSQVYWNSRLQQEHQRIVNLYAPYKEKSSTEDGHVICDVMAGVGPFSLPLAKRGLFVYCNDLNPQSYLWFLENIKLNKINSDRIKIYNKDGRRFLKDLVQIIDNDSTLPWFDVVLMNLPASAVEVLDVFNGLYRNIKRTAVMPTIHCYCFHLDNEPVEHLFLKVKKHLGPTLKFDSVKFFQVRKVSPKKSMYCVSFKLPEDIGFGFFTPDYFQQNCLRHYLSENEGNCAERQKKFKK
ncbi:uncharacterized protein LOC135121951 [Zophobas morio]|uniref:uncharacterized protein LOC135121951 n=1 Tax=Zophobas morio TaxID=2755281 RepID=UPI0030837BDF